MAFEFNQILILSIDRRPTFANLNHQQENFTVLFTKLTTKIDINIFGEQKKNITWAYILTSIYFFYEGSSNLAQKPKATTQ